MSKTKLTVINNNNLTKFKDIKIGSMFKHPDSPTIFIKIESLDNSNLTSVNIHRGSLAQHVLEGEFIVLTDVTLTY